MNAAPCKDPTRPEYRQFDFWTGEWDVFANGSTTQVGSNSIQLILNDCVIYENWTARGGGEGKSFNKYNPVQKQWEQYWMARYGSSRNGRRRAGRVTTWSTISCTSGGSRAPPFHLCVPWVYQPQAAPAKPGGVPRSHGGSQGQRD